MLGLVVRIEISGFSDSRAWDVTAAQGLDVVASGVKMVEGLGVAVNQRRKRKGFHLSCVTSAMIFHDAVLFGKT